jgi:hypothetical protein
VRIGRVRGALVVNPLQSQEAGHQSLLPAGRDAIIMVEGGAKVVSKKRKCWKLCF